MRGYTVVTSAVALEVDYKWMDNLLSHYSVFGVKQARQGVSRTVPYSALLVIAIALELTRELHVPLPKALEWASRASKGENPAQGAFVGIAINLEALDRQLLDRLAYAVEVAPVPRRGRPPREK